MIAPADVIANRRWTRRTKPFPHFVAEGLFREGYYRDLESGFHEVLSRGLANRWDGRRFCRSASGYDAHVLPFSKGLPDPFHVLLSRPWHDVLARVTHVDATGDVDGGLHHHEPGTADGWLHTDLSPGWFAGAVGKEEVQLSDGRRCEYVSGRATSPGVIPVERVRGAAMILYLANGPWAPADGGETGLYETPDGAGGAFVAPADNSMLLFECTPFSYHAFRRNRRKARNSLVLWIHRSREDAVARFGEASIVPWRPRVSRGMGARP